MFSRNYSDLRPSLCCGHISLALQPGRQNQFGFRSAALSVKNQRGSENLVRSIAVSEERNAQSDDGATNKGADAQTSVNTVRNLTGFELDFFIPTANAAFTIGRDSKRKGEVENRNRVKFYIHPSQKHLRKLTLTASRCQSVVGFWRDLLHMAENGGRVLLDTTTDGTRYKLRMLVPLPFCGPLLGEKGAILKAIAEETGCIVSLEPVKEGSTARLLVLVGNNQALLAALKQVLDVLERVPNFTRVLPVQGFVTVPLERFPEVEELLQDLQEKYKGVTFKWIKPPQSVEKVGGKRLMISGPPEVVRVVKEDLSQLFGGELQSDWSRKDWPGYGFRS